MQFVNHQVFDPAWHRRAGSKFVGPEVRFGHTYRRTAAWGLEIARNEVERRNHAAANGPIELGRAVRIVAAARIDESASDLVPREHVWANDGASLRVANAEPVRRVFELREVGQYGAVPDAAIATLQGHYRPRRIDAV